MSAKGSRAKAFIGRLSHGSPPPVASSFVIADLSTIISPITGSASCPEVSSYTAVGEKRKVPASNTLSDKAPCKRKQLVIKPSFNLGLSASHVDPSARQSHVAKNPQINLSLSIHVSQSTPRGRSAEIMKGSLAR